MGFDGFIQILLGSLIQAAILALATFGIVLIFKTSSTTNFAQGSIASFGAYVMYAVINMLYDKNSGGYTPWYIYLIGMLASIIVAFLIGLFVDTIIIRKAKFITSAGKQMITMGLVLILTALTDIIFGVLPKTIDRISYENFGTTGNFQITMTGHELFGIILAFTVLTLVFMSLRFTKWGLGVRATASNEIVSSMMGVNTRFITAMSWAIAGALGALAAALYAPVVPGYLSSAMMSSFQVNGFLALILGGSSTFFGPIVAAIIIPIASGIISYYNSAWSNVIIYALILIVILIKPNGLFGKKVQKKV